MKYWGDRCGRIDRPPPAGLNRNSSLFYKKLPDYNECRLSKTQNFMLLFYLKILIFVGFTDDPEI